jgi:hypothetical protein
MFAKTEDAGRGEGDGANRDQGRKEPERTQDGDLLSDRARSGRGRHADSGARDRK